MSQGLRGKADLLEEFGVVGKLVTLDGGKFGLVAFPDHFHASLVVGDQEGVHLFTKPEFRGTEPPDLQIDRQFR